MRTKSFRHLSASLVAAGLIATTASAAWASEPEIYDWPDADAPVLIKNSSGVLVVGKDKQVMRAFSWRANTGARHTPVYLVDMNRDGKPDIVGAGTPTFVLRTNSDPVFSLEKGCRQVIVADFVADTKLDVMCQNGRTIQVYTDDGQFVWELALGRNIEWCRAGDINGDLKADIECKYQGANQYARVDGATAAIIAQQTGETEIEDDAISLTQAEPVGRGALEGTASFDLNGDGNKAENLLVDGKALVIQSKTAGVEPVRVETRDEVVAAIVKDLDGDGTLEVVALTRNNVFVISDGGKTVASFAADAKRYKRQPHADLSSLHANGFESDDDARAAVVAAQDRLSACYSSRIKKNPYTGIGRLLIQVSVDDKGKVTRAQQMHSDLNDGQVERCARDVLQKIKFPAASGDQATVNINMTYTFRDK